MGHFFHIFFSIFEFSSIVLEYSRTVFESLRNGFFNLGFLSCGLFSGCSRFPFPSNGHVTSSDPNIRVGKVVHFTSSFTYQKILYSLALQRGDFRRDILQCFPPFSCHSPQGSSVRRFLVNIFSYSSGFCLKTHQIFIFSSLFNKNFVCFA